MCATLSPCDNLSGSNFGFWACVSPLKGELEECLVMELCNNANLINLMASVFHGYFCKGDKHSSAIQKVKEETSRQIPGVFDHTNIRYDSEYVESMRN